MTDKQIILSLTRELEAATKPKWVSVDEQLPELKVRVLAFDFNGFGTVSARLGSAGWYLEGVLDNHCNVTHWQPLPPDPEAK